VTSDLQHADVVTDTCHQLDPQASMVARVHPGSVFRCRTNDASGGQISETVVNADLVPALMFPVTGPIEVENVRAGDGVGIEIHSIVPLGDGHTWTRPGLGFAAPVDFNVRRVSAMNPIIDWGVGPAISVPGNIHIGALGVLPEVVTAPRTLGNYGGNLDFTGCRAGSTVWFTAALDGAGVFVGDVHAAMGDGEVCGTGIEVAADITLTAHHNPDWAPRIPTVVMGGRIWLIGVGDTFDEALAVGVEECVRAMADAQRMSVGDAYLAVGLLLEIKVCQMVNPRRSVAVSLSGGADSMLMRLGAR
jgi:amidase